MSPEILLKYFGAKKHHKILDLGCGNGALVNSLISQGYNVCGCDIATSEETPLPTSSLEPNVFHTIETSPYKLPFDDDTFDFVISSQVFEHVMDYESTLKEVHRILVPGGISVNTFPGKYALIEPHTFVPFASFFRPRFWLYLWAMLGVRNEFQVGKTVKEVTSLNNNYLQARTNYLTPTQIKKHASMFSEVAFREDVLLSSSVEERKKQSRKKKLFVLLGGNKLRSTVFPQRALFLRK
jgi:SAM-dependent methyltransferase